MDPNIFRYSYCTSAEIEFQSPPQSYATAFFTGGFEAERDELVQSLITDVRKVDTFRHLQDSLERSEAHVNIALSLDSYTKNLEDWKEASQLLLPYREAVQCFVVKCDRIMEEMILQIQEITRIKNYADIDDDEHRKEMCHLSEILDMFSIHVGMLAIHGGHPTSYVEIMRRTAFMKDLHYQNSRPVSKIGKKGAYLDARSIWFRLYSPVDDCDCYPCLASSVS